MCYQCKVTYLFYFVQIIQDINALKRLLRQAETDYHALYRYFARQAMFLTKTMCLCICITVCVCVCDVYVCLCVGT